ncbi:hypothetical protein DY218_21560 [Streptomyces triticagri]|uniref:Uncharacterized protein n=1 Tax=Streptomyces triticagri TaxID=2293568 RepID=A0A372M124_9ACTN|nr:hypothetical protein DY218_21560 [Streptomyces triticagri]
MRPHDGGTGDRDEAAFAKPQVSRHATGRTRKQRRTGRTSTRLSDLPRRERARVSLVCFAVLNISCLPTLPRAVSVANGAQDATPSAATQLAMSITV